MVRHALSRCERFTFRAGTWLRHDHLDRRVVAEFEGAAQVVPLHATASLTIEGDDYVLVTADDDQDVDLVVTNGPLTMEFEAAMAECDGCGWVAGDDIAAVVDGQSVVLCKVPAPFRFGFRAGGPCRVTRVDAVVVELCRWRIDDLATQKSIGLQVKNQSKIVLLPDGTPVASHLNAMRWRVDVPVGVEALLLEKSYDRFHGRQRARVLVDGEIRGWWYAPIEDRTRRLATTRFAVPVEGGRTVEITIDPPAGAPLWSVAEMVVYGIGSPTRIPRPFVPM